MIPMIYTLKMCTSVATQLACYPIVYFAFLHCTGDGALMINNDSLNTDPADPCILPGVQQLTANGQIVLLSVGGTNSGLAGGDYANIQNNYSTFWANLQTAMQVYGFDGIDLDLEGNYEPYLDTLVQLVNDASAAGYIVTAPPYSDMSFWQSLASQSAFPDGDPKILAYNIQTYGGADYASWVEGFAGISPDPQTFIGSGYLSNDTPPSAITSTLDTLLSSYPDSALAFIWRFPHAQAGSTACDYATAIQAASPASTAAALVRTHRARLSTLGGRAGRG